MKDVQIVEIADTWETSHGKIRMWIRGYMMGAKQVRWICPLCQSGVLAPTKPRADDTRRLCLACSAKSPRLVRRVAVALDKKRAKKKGRARERARKNYELVPPTGYYLIQGVNVEDRFQAAGGKGRLRVRKTKTYCPTTVKIESGLLTTTIHYGDWSDRFDMHAAAVVAAARSASMVIMGKYMPIHLTKMIRISCERSLAVRPRLDSLRNAEREAAALVRARRAAEKLDAMSTGIDRG